MPPKQRNATTPSGSPVLAGESGATKPAKPKALRCKALTTSGNRCRKRAVTGLTVCDRHGGGTAASVRKSTKARVSHQAVQMWGISADTGSVSIVDELNKLARNKLTDITALRIKLGENPEQYYGMLLDTEEVTENDITGTTRKEKKVSGTHPLVQELHKTEHELLAILRLLQEVTGADDGDQDLVRVRMQTAREAARLLKSFPGIAVEDVAAEVAKRA